MWIIEAPVENYGRIPWGKSVLHPDVKFFNNIAFCSKYYYAKIHLLSHCIDITPVFLRKHRTKREIQNILVIAKGGIGDVLWIFPFIRELKNQNPKSQIAVLTEDRTHQLFHHFPYITCAVKDEMWNVQSIFDASDEIYDFGGMVTIHKELHRHDPVDRPFILSGMKKPSDPANMLPHLVLSVAEGKDATNVLSDNGINVDRDRFICIATESSTANRDWPMSFNFKLSQMFSDAGFKVVFLSAKKENAHLFYVSCECGWESIFSSSSHDQLVEVICRQCGERISTSTNRLSNCCANLSGKTSLRQYMSIVAMSDLFIGPNSSGIVIATALGVPTLGLFGAFDPRGRTNYYKKFSYILGKCTAGKCEDHWTECPLGSPAPCMRSINPAMVFDEALALIKEYPRRADTKKPIE